MDLLSFKAWKLWQMGPHFCINYLCTCRGKPLPGNFSEPTELHAAPGLPQIRTEHYFVSLFTQKWSSFLKKVCSPFLQNKALLGYLAPSLLQDSGRIMPFKDWKLNSQFSGRPQITGYFDFWINDSLYRKSKRKSGLDRLIFWSGRKALMILYTGCTRFQVHWDELDIYFLIIWLNCSACELLQHKSKVMAALTPLSES